MLQLLDVGQDMISVPEMHIEDQPEKGYRAFMADLSGYWHPFEKLLRFVDICFLYKVNHLHLHFVDNKLYTLPSKAYPKLMKDGQHYTEEQIRYLNTYAKERGIVLVPEYECPGHAPVMVLAYPELFADTFEEETGSDFYDEQGYLIETFHLMCAGSETCIEANKVLLKEISDLFPEAPYIHIGGDEANIKLWDSCSVCKKYMQEHQIEDVYELYSDFIGRIAEYVISLGKTPMVWEGFPRKGSHRVPKETIVIAWESMYHLPQDLVEEGFRIINGSWQPLYIVCSRYNRWSPFDILRWNVYNWQNWFYKSDAYLNPITIQPTEQVLGGLLRSWGLPYELEINFVMENLAAMVERTWTVKRVCSDQDFEPKLKRLVKRVAFVIQDR